MKVKAFITAKWDKWEKKYDYDAWPCVPSDSDRVLVEEREIEFTPPPADVLQAGTVAAFRAEQARIRADATLRINGLQQQIDEMLAITYKSEAAQ